MSTEVPEYERDDAAIRDGIDEGPHRGRLRSPRACALRGLDLGRQLRGSDDHVRGRTMGRSSNLIVRTTAFFAVTVALSGCGGEESTPQGGAAVVSGTTQPKGSAAIARIMPSITRGMTTSHTRAPSTRRSASSG